MEKKLYIDGQELPLQQGQDVAITLVGNDLTDPTRINSSYTNTFKVPTTALFKSIFNNPTQHPKANGAYDAKPAILDIGGMYMIDGTAYLREANQETADIFFVSGARDFFDDLGEVDLRSIVLLSTEHFRTRANVAAKINDDYTDKYSYAFLDWGQNITDASTALDYAYMYPLPFAHAVMNAIADRAGWTIKATGLMSNAFFRKLAIAWNGHKYNSENYFNAYNERGSLTSGTAPGQYVNIASSLGWQLNGQTPATFDVYTKRFYAPANGLYCAFSFECQDVDILAESGQYDFDVRIVIRAQSGDGLLFTLANYSSGLVTSGDTTITIPKLYTDWHPVPAGTYVQIEMRVTKGLEVAINKGYWVFSEEFLIAPQTNIEIYPHLYLPKMLARDFFKYILLMLNSVAYFDVAKKEITLRTFNDASATEGGTWIGKADTLREVRKEYYYSPYGRVNYLRYTNDEELAEGYAEGSISVGNAQAPAEFELLKVPFSATLDRFFNSSLNICKVPVFDGGATPEYLKELKPRLVYLESKTGSLDITGGGTSTVTSFNLSRFAVPSDTISLHFGSENGLVVSFFGALSAMLNVMERVTVKVKLNAADLRGLDMTLPVWLNENFAGGTLTGYYFINEIKEWRGGVAEVVLIYAG